jgi:hypothetical protein
MSDKEYRVKIEPHPDDFGEHLLRIECGDYRKEYTDSMEPEDATFLRDLSWVEEELRGAYDLGKAEALEARKRRCGNCDHYMPTSEKCGRNHNLSQWFSVGKGDFCSWWKELDW